jgi:UDP-3-O-[3-hydroxymyristoyl] N-acetylglucosamine deacetylase
MTSKARILIVDDQEKILSSLSEVLKDEGHEVILARDGQEALHIVQSDSPHVVFLDIWIPGIDGMQTLKAIKRIDPDCSVVMMSGHGTIETAVKAIKLGALDYLEKPLNLEDVLHIVDRVVAGTSGLPEPLVPSKTSAEEPIGGSERSQGLRRAIERAAKDRGPLWLTGDEGTGKEFVARVIHHKAGMDRNTLVKARCTDLTLENFNDEFFGSPAGADGTRGGKIRQARGGTLLLLRIDRLRKEVRPKLADFLNRYILSTNGDSGGSSSTIRLMCTSMSDPSDVLADEHFPKALAQWLGNRIIRVPSLRERGEDIPFYAMQFLQEAAREFDRNIQGFDDEALERLMAYTWPGNIKELKILIEHVVMTAPGPMISVSDLLIPGQNVCAPSGVDSPISPITVSEPGDSSRQASSPTSLSAEASGPRKASPHLRFQKTLRGRVVMYGQGLHSGTKTGLTLSPLPPSAGILFGHITSDKTVPALLEHVESTAYSTCLRQNGSMAKTIEHLMAVFHVYGLTNVLVKISGEVPIMDGSALEFCRLIEAEELISQDEPIEEIRVSEPIELPESGPNGKSMRVEPSDELEVEYFMDYPPPVGKMQFTFRCGSSEAFKQEIAPARTFGFVKDMRMMDEMGLAGGGSLSNVVLLDDEKVINPPLRFPDEFVRHKILDIIGDFYLLGRPFVGKIIAHQTGHTENIAMLRLISERIAKSRA